MEIDLEVTLPSQTPVKKKNVAEDLEGEWFTEKGAPIAETLFDLDDFDGDEE
jgi:hypothetical protein